MNFTDPIILTAYLLCIAYCIYRIINAFNDEFTIRFDTDLLSQQLADQNLQGVLTINFGFAKQYEFDKLILIPIIISNLSDSHSIYVDWDNSVFRDISGRARRVTRITPGSTLDLSQTQVFSTIAPKTTLIETITAEDALQRKNPPALDITVGKPLLDPGALRKNNKFMKRYVELELFLELALRVTGPGRTLEGDRVRILCRFILKKLPWQAGLPWTPR